MKTPRSLLGATAVLLIIVLNAQDASAQAIYDLRNDWVDTVNPQSPWSFYNVDPNNHSHLLGLMTPGTFTGDTFATPQAAFGNLPGIFKSNGTEQFWHGWETGDIVLHSDFSYPIAIVWTAPIDTPVTIDITAWQTRILSRDTHFGLYMSGAYYFENGFVGTDPSHPYLDSYSRTMLAGEQIIFWSRSVTTLGDYMGVDLKITASAVPEPSAYGVATAIALVGVAWSRRRNRNVKGNIPA